MWAVERNILGRRRSKVASFLYFSQGQVTVVISSNILQFLEIERDDFVVQSRQLLLLDIIVWLVWNDGDFWSKILCQEWLKQNLWSSPYSSGNRSLYRQLCRSASFPSRHYRQGRAILLSSDNRQAIDSHAFHQLASMASDSLACLKVDVFEERKEENEEKKRREKNRYCFSF